MNLLINLHNGAFGKLEGALAPWFLPTLARFAFAAVLLRYFWNSAYTKIYDFRGETFEFFGTTGAYVQILPKIFEAASYDVSQVPAFYKLVVIAGTYTEFLLPLLILLGLFTRLAALGMTGFVIVQSYVDVTGHHADETTIGGWFDTGSDSLILDQRLLWFVLFAILIVRGAGPLSLDALLGRKAA